MSIEKIAIVCNSTNPDLVQYFKCKIDSIEESKLLILKNSKINLEKESINSSFMDSAFFDKKVIIDFIHSFYLFFLLLKHRVKVIHFTTAHVSNLFLSLLLKPFSIKQIFTIHDLVPHPGRKSYFIDIYNRVILNFLSDEIISFSKKEIEKQEKKDKFKYMPLSGFPQYITKPKVGNKTILFFGRIESYKGLNNLIDLIHKSNELKTGYNFIIAGKGEIKNLTELLKIKNLRIINRFIDDTELFELFNESTFTILPYDSATQSGVSILSFSYATPVLAYNVGSLSEYIDNHKNGVIVEHRDNNKLLHILNSYDENEIFKMSNLSIEKFVKSFSKEACIEQYKNYYKGNF